LTIKKKADRENNDKQQKAVGLIEATFSQSVRTGDAKFKLKGAVNTVVQEKLKKKAGANAAPVVQIAADRAFERGHFLTKNWNPSPCMRDHPRNFECFKQRARVARLLMMSPRRMRRKMRRRRRDNRPIHRSCGLIPRRRGQLAPSHLTLPSKIDCDDGDDSVCYTRNGQAAQN